MPVADQSSPGKRCCGCPGVAEDVTVQPIIDDAPAGTHTLEGLAAEVSNLKTTLVELLTKNGQGRGISAGESISLPRSKPAPRGHSPQKFEATIAYLLNLAVSESTKIACIGNSGCCYK